MEGKKRVRYKKSPLIEVIFQLRFPTILSINYKLPADFQDKIRMAYPLFQDGTEQQNELLIRPDLSSGALKRSQNKNYAFISEDGNFRINLTSSFISLSTIKYTQWEDFIDRINFIIPIFEELYQPAFYTRVGLRYIDVFTRSKLGLTDKHWSDLIQPQILGMMTGDLEEGTVGYLTETEYHDSKENTAIRKHVEMVHVDNNPERSLLIDCDYFSLTNVKKDNMVAMANKLHESSTNFLKSTIKNELDKAMEPEEKCEI